MTLLDRTKMGNVSANSGKRINVLMAARDVVRIQ